ncbi:MAG: D-sedoheptulose 7-phosphate isomerase [Mariprofundaceae bacterium]|nr:D-sedoheptulose 7-phosphate isomerase [Mariprofundaceae bacterium]
MKTIMQQAFSEGIALRQLCATKLAGPLENAAGIMISCLQHGGKILVCGNGGSAADAQHFAGELVNRFEIDRPGLASIALTSDASVITSIANDSAYEEVFARQVEALGCKGDVLLAISTSGNSANVNRAVTVAGEKGMQVIALTGKNGGELATHPAVNTLLNIPHTSTPRIQELHITCLHILCSLIDHQLYGEAS